MVVPVHTGLEHPNLLWMVLVGILTFVAGLAVNLHSAPDDGTMDQDPTTDEDSID